MKQFRDQAKIKRDTLHAVIHARHPGLRQKPVLIARPPIDRSALVLGRNQGQELEFLFERARLEHAHVIGTTGGGKTRLIEHCFRQDVVNERGVCVIDPHGNHPDSLYRSALGWLDEHGYTKTRTIHLIDPNAATHTTGFDPLALPDESYDPAVIADAAREALERIWGEEDTDTKPTLQRVLSATLTALCELDLTFAEAHLLFDPHDRHGFRAWAIENIVNQETREELQYLHDIAAEPRGRQDFRVEVTGPRNRIAKLIRTESVRTMVGQRAKRVDFRQALDEGHIILANLAGGPRASDQACQLLGRLLTRFLFFHAQRRNHPERPFFFYLDECQLYLSGDVSRLLAEARKYGVGVMLAHQYLWQLQKAGEDILHAVRNTTNLKAVFRLKDPKEAEDLAHMVVPLDLEMPVRASMRPTVVGVELVRLKSESSSSQESSSETRSESEGRNITETELHVQSYAETIAEGESETESATLSSADGASRMSLAGTGQGITANQMTVPATGAVGLSEGANSASQASQGAGTSSSQGRSFGTARARTSMHAVTAGEAIGHAVARGINTATETGRGQTRGLGKTQGTQEAYKSVYQNLPTSFHSKEHAQYFAAQTLRTLTTGKAFINFVDADGMHAALLTVAPVNSSAPGAAVFDELRQQILDASPSASPIDEARENIAHRQRTLIEDAGRARECSEPDAPKAFRIKRKRRPKAKS